MSIAGAIYAEYAEKVRKEWAAELQAAIAARDWDAVQAVSEKIAKYRFSE